MPNALHCWDEHEILIDMLLGFFYDYGRCPIHGQDFNHFDFEPAQLATIASTAPPKPFGIRIIGTLTNLPESRQDQDAPTLEEIIANATYFKEIQFNPVGNNQCQLTAKLQTHWNEEWDNTNVLYGINTTNGTITCDPLFSRISPLCKLSTQHLKIADDR